MGDACKTSPRKIQKNRSQWTVGREGGAGAEKQQLAADGASSRSPGRTQRPGGGTKSPGPPSILRGARSVSSITGVDLWRRRTAARDVRDARAGTQSATGSMAEVPSVLRWPAGQLRHTRLIPAGSIGGALPAGGSPCMKPHILDDAGRDRVRRDYNSADDPGHQLHRW